MPKWHLAYFVPIDGQFGQIVRYGLQFVLPGIKINFDIQTKFEVNQTQIGHSVPKNSKNSPNWPYLKTKKPTSPTFFDVNMDFAHINHGRFLI